MLRLHNIVVQIALVAIIVHLHRILEKARHEASHDTLTGLMSRATASHHLAKRCKDRRATTAVLLDLDNFKTVNDIHGHLAGDRMLAAVGFRLAAAVRHLDGVAARYGGDEFLLILPAAPLPEHTRQIQKMLEDLAAPVYIEGRAGAVALRPSASAGMATATDDTDWAGLLYTADTALYTAKQARVHLGRGPCAADKSKAGATPRLRRVAYFAPSG